MSDLKTLQSTPAGATHLASLIEKNVTNQQDKEKIRFAFDQWWLHAKNGEKKALKDFYEERSEELKDLDKDLVETEGRKIYILNLYDTWYDVKLDKGNSDKSFEAFWTDHGSSEADED